MSASPRLYRLPSGAITWIDRSWDDATARNVSVADLAYVLGSRLRRRDDVPALSELQVVWWEDVDEQLAEAVKRVIGSPHRAVALETEDLGFRHGLLSPIVPGQDVLVLMGSLATGRTAGSVLRTIRRMGGTTSIVASVVDGRTDCGGPLPTFGGPVPVVSCLARTLVVAQHEVDRDALITDVDPGRPEPEVSRPISPDQFISWLKNDRESGIFVGHIDRGRARHFTTYLNVGYLVASHPEAIDAIVESARAALISHMEGNDILAIVFPRTEDAFAQTLARSVTRRLRDEGRVEVEEFGIRRRAGVGWEWPRSTAASAFHALVLDWGAVTTTTLRTMMRLAAERGAIRVHAVGLTSQLDEAVERQLTSIASIRTARQQPDPLEGWQQQLRLQEAASAGDTIVEVPVSSAFLSRVPMGMAPAAECPLCRLAEQLRVTSEHAPSRLLRQHAQRKYELYRPRNRRDTLAAAACDLVGSPLTPDGAADIWDARQLLEDARTSTASRASVRQTIEGWPSGPSATRSIVAWLRLLTAEPYWFNRAPLDAQDVRRRIGLTCVDLLMGHPPGGGVDRLRWQAAIILRAASKHLFLERFGRILEAVADDEEVAAELCYGMHTLLERPYNQQRPILAAALSALSDAQTRLIERRQNDVSSRDLLATVSALYRSAVELRRRIMVRVDDPLAAWHALESSYVLAMNTHAGALTSMLVVLNALSGPAAEHAAMAADGPETRVESYWSDIADAWIVCWDFLAGTVFPFLPLLGDLFEASTFAMADEGDGPLTGFDGRRASEFNERLIELEGAPRRFSPTVRLALEAEAFAWFNALLRAPESGSSGREHHQHGGSRLLRILVENPCDLATAWEVALYRAEGAGMRIAHAAGEISPATLVFCRRSLLIETLGQILENAAGPRHATSGRPAEGVQIGLGVSESSETVELTVKNNWTTADRAHEGGLTHFAEELALFGADLKHGVPVRADFNIGKADWTYEVRLSLRAWRENP